MTVKGVCWDIGYSFILVFLLGSFFFPGLTCTKRSYTLSLYITVWNCT